MLAIDDLEVELDADAGVVRAVDALQLAVEQGETFALVGESGCGKSMTALALMRLLPEGGEVTRGEVTLGAGGGHERADVLDLPEYRMRAVRGGRIGMIFQEPSTSLNPVMRVGDQIVEAIQAHTALRGAGARAKAVQWLERVGIPEPARRVDDYPFRMSGGQKQRVMIAMTLAAEPDFLVADEPTTALDVTIQAQILELLKDLQRERRMGLLLITHDLAVVAGMAHRVALMYAGQIVEVARAGDFFARPLHPYAQALMRALPDASRRGQALEAIPGSVPALNQRFDGCRFAPRCTHAAPACVQQAPEMARLAGGREVRCLRVAAGEPLVGTARSTGVAVERAAAQEPPPLLKVVDLSVRFLSRTGTHRWWGGAAHDFVAVDRVSFDVRRGQTLALVGESGCGKTTTGKAIAQLLRRFAHVEGRVMLGTEDLVGLAGPALQRARRGVQIVFQDPFASLDPRMRVAELLEEGIAALIPELDRPARRERIEALLDQVGLPRDALARYPHEFSGGQRQRIAIARALAVQPSLLICDEPTSALDVSVQAQILNLLRDLQERLGLAYLFITHNIAVVECMADNVLVMRNGRVVERGAVFQVLESPRAAYTRELIAAAPRLGAART